MCLYSGRNFLPVLKIELWSHARIATLTFYTACAVCLLFLVLAGNSTLFQFLCIVTRSYSSHPFLSALVAFNLAHKLFMQDYRSVQTCT